MDDIGSENYGGKKIPWAETPVWVRIPPWVRISVIFGGDFFVPLNFCLYNMNTTYRNI